jgi:hypothetical protein
MMLRDLVASQTKKHNDKMIVEQALKRARNWLAMGSAKLVPLSEVSWLLALLTRSGVMAEELGKASGVQKDEAVSGDGSRVITVVASESIETRSEAG